MILVCAGSFPEFNSFCWEELEMPEQVVQKFGIYYVSDRRRLREISRGRTWQVVIYGRFWERRDAAEIWEELRYLRAMGRIL